MDRKLDRKLILFVKQKLGDSSHLVLPMGKRKEGESMRQVKCYWWNHPYQCCLFSQLASFVIAIKLMCYHKLLILLMWVWASSYELLSSLHESIFPILGLVSTTNKISQSNGKNIIGFSNFGLKIVHWRGMETLSESLPINNVKYYYSKSFISGGRASFVISLRTWSSSCFSEQCSVRLHQIQVPSYSERRRRFCWC